MDNISNPRVDASAILRKHLVWDNHVCMPLRPGDDEFLERLEAVRELGVDVCVLNVTFDSMERDLGLTMIDTFSRWVAARPERFTLVKDVAAIERARATGRMGICFNIEGGCALNDDLSMVARYHALGVRWMLIAYNRNNALGGGCQDNDQGLTDFGRAAVREMERVGMAVCCSHTGERTSLDVMAWARKPVIYSHSNPAAVHPHPRNISDAAMRACAATGGVVCLNGIGIFLGHNDASPATFARHVDQVVRTIGVAHVGLGLDFCHDRADVDAYLQAHPQLFPPSEGYDAGIRMLSPLELPEVVRELVQLGYDEPALAAILGANLMRVARQTWA